MKIAIASDHAGFEYKSKLIPYLQKLGHEVKDFGTNSPEMVDYPLYIRPAAQAVAKGECERGIVMGGSGNGEAIVANKVKGVRCALCWTEQTAIWGRAHNDANCISIGARTVDYDLVVKMIDLFLKTPFEGGRHIKRIAEIE